MPRQNQLTRAQEAILAGAKPNLPGRSVLRLDFGGSGKPIDAFFADFTTNNQQCVANLNSGTRVAKQNAP
jgi:hypothetical protein